MGAEGENICSTEEVEKAFVDKINTDIYPETFAMIISAASITLKNYREYIKGYGWVESENVAVYDLCANFTIIKFLVDDVFRFLAQSIVLL